jgi:hypothetical protein
MMGLRWLLSSVIIIGMSVMTWANAPIVARHTLTPSVGNIGDAMMYELTITFNNTVQLIDVGASGVNSPLSVLKFEKFKETRNGLTVFRSVAKISAFEIGVTTIAPRSIQYKVGGKVETLVLPGIDVQILSVLTATNNQIQDIKRARALDLPWGALGLLIAVILTPIIAGLAYVWMKRSSLQPVVPIIEEDTRSIEQRALDALGQLKFNETDIDAFYVGLSAILRGYLGHRFGIDSEEMTSSELETAISEHCNPILLQKVVRVLQLCDWVKFAQFIPVIEDATIAKKQVKEIVNELTVKTQMETPDAVG